MKSSSVATLKRILEELLQSFYFLEIFSNVEPISLTNSLRIVVNNELSMLRNIPLFDFTSGKVCQYWPLVTSNSNFLPQYTCHVGLLISIISLMTFITLRNLGAKILGLSRLLLENKDIFSWSRQSTDDSSTIGSYKDRRSCKNDVMIIKKLADGIWEGWMRLWLK